MSVNTVAQAEGILLEMLYVGKRNLKENVGRNICTITVDGLSHTMQEMEFIWLFWARLDSMWHSKMKYYKSIENDQMVQEIDAIHSFDRSDDQGWL
ncbi:hypothetical protein LWI28_009992 [Acer negundo]|uniref:Sieve element occlusion C-terminal domain-containing protein n=1 Tax=Acer negundo TaxID=4023 RepID=A0AAD5NIA3_ACENE|nr:hypothetical protein LWI28_009992 [Acer negundo]KAK4838379.1 hypothetical protein QYF36_013313 [Acer negundo]